MIVIRNNALPTSEDFAMVAEEIHRQAETGGVIVLPYFCEVLAVTDDSHGLQITQGKRKEDPRVEQLEKELAAALADLATAKVCETCKHAALMTEWCSRCGCDDCDGVICKGFCKTCANGSNWEWRGYCEPV